MRTEVNLKIKKYKATFSNGFPVKYYNAKDLDHLYDQFLREMFCLDSSFVRIFPVNENIPYALQGPDGYGVFLGQYKEPNTFVIKDTVCAFNTVTFEEVPKEEWPSLDNGPDWKSGGVNKPMQVRILSLPP